MYMHVLHVQAKPDSTGGAYVSFAFVLLAVATRKGQDVSRGADQAETGRSHMHKRTLKSKCSNCMKSLQIFARMRHHSTTQEARSIEARRVASFQCMVTVCGPCDPLRLPRARCPACCKKISIPLCHTSGTAAIKMANCDRWVTAAAVGVDGEHWA